MAPPDAPRNGRPLVGVLLGSRSEFNFVRRGLETLRVMGVPYSFDVICAHRDPGRLGEWAVRAADRGLEVLVVAGGASSAAPGMVAAYTNLPVIGLPIDSSPLRGQDALLAMVMSASGAPVATVGINQSENAAILAVQVLALGRPEYRGVLAHRRAAAIQRAETSLGELRNEFPELCDPARTSTSARVDPTTQDTEPGLGLDETPRVSRDGGERIRPGATSAARPAGRVAQGLVPTPTPQEPAGDPRAPPPPTLQSILGRAPTPESEADTRDPGLPAISPDPATADTDDRSLDPANGRLTTEDGHDDPYDVATPIEDEVEEKAPIETKFFVLERDNPDPDVLDHAMMVLLEGGVVALPTDTVYGLAADATNRPAVERLYRMKGREHQRTMGVMISHPDMLIRLAKEVPPALEKVLEQCWPGPLTVILPKHPGTLASVTPSDRIGVRIPDDMLCLRVLERVGRPLAVRNASLSASRPMIDPDAVAEAYSGHVDCILGAGLCSLDGAPSSVLNATVEPFELLREGGVPRSVLKELLGDHLAN